jgi:hypothetical protein
MPIYFAFTATGGLVVAHTLAHVESFSSFLNLYSTISTELHVSCTVIMEDYFV